MITIKNRKTVADLKLFETAWIRRRSLAFFNNQTHVDTTAIVNSGKAEGGNFIVQVKNTIDGYKVAVPRTLIVERANPRFEFDYTPVAQILRGRQLPEEIIDMQAHEEGWTLPTAVEWNEDACLFGLRFDHPVFHDRPDVDNYQRPVQGLLEIYRLSSLCYHVVVPRDAREAVGRSDVPFTPSFGYVPVDNVSYQWL